MTLHRPVLLSSFTAVLLAACGGGGEPVDAPAPDVGPLYELAAVLPPEPSDIDADGSAASAALPPGRATLLGSAAGDDAQSLRLRIQSAGGNGETATTQAAAAAVYYTPAQMRAAYGLDKLPALSAANQGAYLGSGQTIAIVGAFHNATAATDLAVFTQKFGLPACTLAPVAATAALPLARPAAGTGCALSIVYATAAGGMTGKVPAANAGWQTESALDLQWAHAMAPMARLILVEAASASSADIMGAITLARRLGASVVSMSFGAAEFAGQSAYDGLFTAPGVTYLAATGDNGRAVAWPAVSPQVLAVGGTTLAFNGSTRSESGWAGTGGGLSAYTAVPAWQTGLKVTDTAGKVAAPVRRALPDVAFNANPSSGQLVYVTTSGGAGWLVVGGTSIGTPQWAGLVAVANAARALGGKASLGNLGAPLFRTIGGNAAAYAAALLDVSTGANGSCRGCTATTGYDLVTGLGTPNAVKLVEQLGAL